MPPVVSAWLFLAGLVVVGVIYFRFALLDHRYPENFPSVVSLAWNTGLLLLLVVAANAAFSRGDAQHHLDLTLMILGVLTAPAIAPPVYVDKRTHPRMHERLAFGLRDRVSQAVAVKVIAGALFVLLFILGSAQWALALMALCAFLLFAKGAAMLTTEVERAGRSMPTPLELQRSFMRRLLVIVSFGALASALVYAQLPTADFRPNAWTAFAGLGLGSVFFGHRTD